MSVTGIRAFRLVLRLYPAEYRREYGEDMVQLFIDQQLHDRRPASALFLHETFDAVRTALRMRLESPMKIGWLGGSRVQNLHAQGRLDHMDMCGGEPTAWWRIECSHCLKDFVTWDTRRRFCSDQCRTENKRARKQARVAARCATTSRADAEESIVDSAWARPTTTRI
jgi:hypothetical protein